MDLKYYNHSGRYTFSGVLIAFLFGLALSLILSFLNAYNLAKVTMMYLRVVLLALYGVLVGLAIEGGIQIGKIRSHKVLIAIAILINILLVYFRWVFYLTITFNYKFLVIRPDDIIYLIKSFAVSGTWTYKSTTPTGAMQYIIWIGEFLLTTGLSLGTAFMLFDSRIFCEVCNKWTDGNIAIENLEVSQDRDLIKKDLDNGNYNSLLSLTRNELEKNHYYKVSLKFCSSCNTINVLNISEINVTKNSKGKEVKDEKFLVTNLLVPENKVDQVKKFIEGN